MNTSTKQLILKYFPFVQGLVNIRSKFRRILALDKRVSSIENILLAPRIEKLLNMLQPMRAHGYDLIRVGRKGDGGYVMLNMFDNIDAAYSFGIADDVSWDADIAEHGIPVYMYDPSISRLPENNKNFHFHKIGISGNPERDVGMKGISSLLHDNHHTGDVNLLLKIDIEGYEWEAFDRLEEKYLCKFSQIACEFHGLNQLAWADKIHLLERVFRKICTYFHVVHLHANNVGWEVNIDYLKVPVALEISFARKDLAINFTPIDSLCSKLDAENNPNKPPIDISDLWRQNQNTSS